MKKMILFISFFSLLMACKFGSNNAEDVESVKEDKIDLENIKDPEAYVKSVMDDDYIISNTFMEYANDDELLDVHIELMHASKNHLYENYYFLNNDEETYRLVSYEVFWGGIDEPEEEEVEYDEIEDFFNSDMAYEYYADYNKILEIVYKDLNGDGLEDAIAIVHYTQVEYESVNAYVFLKNEEGRYVHKYFVELHSPIDGNEDLIYERTTFKAPYFSFEFEDHPLSLKKITTFNYDKERDEFYLHKIGQITYNLNGGVLKEETQSKKDFGGEVLMGRFSYRDYNLIVKDTVSNVLEFLTALDNNKEIYLKEGTYHFNKIENFDKEAIERIKISENTYPIPIHQFYTVSNNIYSESRFGFDFELTLRYLYNTSFIGLGDVRFIVDNETIAVLKFEECKKLTMENIYLVHEVGSICSGNVIEIKECTGFDFVNVTFDGSGDFGVYADFFEAGKFTDCVFTNCSSGAIFCYNTNAVFNNCEFSNNNVLNYLVTANSFSVLDFKSCIFNKNNRVEKNKTILLNAEVESYIHIDSNCKIYDNDLDSNLNDANYVTIDI